MERPPPLSIWRSLGFPEYEVQLSAGSSNGASNRPRIARAGGLACLQAVKPHFGIVRGRFVGEVESDLGELPLKLSEPWG